MLLAALAGLTPAAGRADPVPAAIVKAAPAADWQPIAPEDLLVMDLAPDAAGHARQVVIQLMPAPFSQGWTGNLRKLAAARWWDATAVYRVQDNYVVQFGDPEEETPRARPVPAGLTTVPQSDYAAPFSGLSIRRHAEGFTLARPGAQPEALGIALPGADAYAPLTAIWHGWPIGLALKPGSPAQTANAWPLHCYGMVGAGRDNAPDTGTGAELYAVIGTPPRQLDRNIALVGRVIEGIGYLSGLPRGTGPMGYYTTPDQRLPIRTIRLATDLPPAERPRFEYLGSTSASFAAYVQARAHRRDAFYIQPAGGVDACNVDVPIRRAGA